MHPVPLVSAGSHIYRRHCRCWLLPEMKPPCLAPGAGGRLCLGFRYRRCPRPLSPLSPNSKARRCHLCRPPWLRDVLAYDDGGIGAATSPPLPPLPGNSHAAAATTIRAVTAVTPQDPGVAAVAGCSAVSRIGAVTDEEADEAPERSVAADAMARGSEIPPFMPAGAQTRTGGNWVGVSPEQRLRAPPSVSRCHHRRSGRCRSHRSPGDREECGTARAGSSSSSSLRQLGVCTPVRRGGQGRGDHGDTCGADRQRLNSSCHVLTYLTLGLGLRHSRRQLAFG